MKKAGSKAEVNREQHRHNSGLVATAGLQGSVAPRRLSLGSRRLSLRTAKTHRELRGKGQALN